MRLSDSLRRLVLPHRQGFSLIEVTMAIGLASFCMLTLIGLLPVGLTVMRDAVDQMTESQIIQQLNGEILQTPFNKLSALSGNTRYFNDDAEAVATMAEARYLVVVTLEDASFPGSTHAPASVVAGSMMRVRLDIAKVQGTAVSVATNRYNIQVSRN